MRFDFMHDARPEIVEALLHPRVPARFHALCAAVAILAAAALSAAGIEQWRAASALGIEARAQQRFEASKIELDRVAQQTSELETLVARDRALRRIRVSGSVIAAKLARLGNLIPRHAWVTSMSAQSDGYALRGRANDFGSLATLLARLIDDRTDGRPATIAIDRAQPQRSSTLTFDIRLDERP